MDPTTRHTLIDRYRDGYREVMDAVRDISPEELDSRPGPGDWSARQVVHHLADSEMTSAIRLRRLIAEDDPQIMGYDEEAFAERLHYDRPIDASLDAHRAARASTAAILDLLSEAEWSRTGTCCSPATRFWTVSIWVWGSCILWPAPIRNGGYS